MFQCVCFLPCLSCYRTIDIVSGGPDLSVSMLSWPIVALFNNVVQLPGDESRLVHSVGPLRHRNAEEPGANARPPQMLTSNETTVMFGSKEMYLPLLPNSLLPYEPSLPSSWLELRGLPQFKRLPDRFGPERLFGQSVSSSHIHVHARTHNHNSTHGRIARPRLASPRLAPPHSHRHASPKLA